jgi:hypothetical protein
MKMNEHGLYRTMKLKYVPYFTDGNGRDRYIAFDNGGFFGNKEVNKENSRRTGTSFDTKITYKYISPYMKTPNFHYHSDGNGRDSYIYTNGGGLYYDTKPLGSYKLTDFLREDSVGTTRQKIWVSKAQHKYNKFLRNKEKGIINRLYENEKGKFMKKKKEEDEFEEEYFQTDNETTKLPKINGNYRTIDTIHNNFENDEEEPKGESRTIDNQRRKRNFMVKNGINNDEMILKSISKINQFDVDKKLKSIHKSFNQAYFHLRNNNLKY